MDFAERLGFALFWLIIATIALLAVGGTAYYQYGTPSERLRLLDEQRWKAIDEANSARSDVEHLIVRTKDDQLKFEVEFRLALRRIDEELARRLQDIRRQEDAITGPRWTGDRYVEHAP